MGISHSHTCIWFGCLCVCVCVFVILDWRKNKAWLKDNIIFVLLLHSVTEKDEEAAAPAAATINIFIFVIRNFWCCLVAWIAIKLVPPLDRIMYQDFDYCWQCRLLLLLQAVAIAVAAAGWSIVLLHALHFSSTHFPLPFCHILTVAWAAPAPPPLEKTGLSRWCGCVCSSTQVR